jgi:hypothetical protein
MESFCHCTGMRRRLRAQAFFCNAYAEDLKLTSSCLKHISTQLQQANLSAISRHQIANTLASTHRHILLSHGQGFILQAQRASGSLLYDARAF